MNVLKEHHWKILFVMVGLLMTGCDSLQPPAPKPLRNFRQDMRDFVQAVSVYAKALHPDFLVIPQNGQELFTDSGTSDGLSNRNYLEAIDGTGREDLFYGYEADDTPTPAEVTERLTALLDLAEALDIQALVTDYCATPAFVDDAYQQNATRGYTAFVAHRRDLDAIPPYPSTPLNVHISNVTSLDQVANFLYLIDSGAHPDKASFLDALRNTDYDLLIIDAFYGGDEPLTTGDVAALKIKAGGGSRLAVAYMSIGEAEDYRYYWNLEWNENPPDWLDEENPDWPGNYSVRYWDEEWHHLILGGEDAYLDRILEAGFDGVYLDVIDAFEYFENL
jgi:cysteinyl-tRNA synthetase